ncbi:DUF1127 domain-containing protein [Sinorhizobium sp. BG8]|uniref:DUF1127 domain-containing protein n=1 Tax=Sinorhizobium sp. BG8 TaxID=2613773 RepID=UPI00193DAE71|nr:DUF1127 domain-containing protein [Sinorhizobium sp. BG8]QRM54436.1 DUF1127 domain-containing protein [Sinorhizobium sp. BG8]
MRMLDRTTDLDLALSLRPAPTYLGRIRNYATMLLRAWRNRRVLGNLDQLDDHQLLDIGLRREDLREAATSSFFGDSSLHLTIAARQRARQHLRTGLLD